MNTFTVESLMPHAGKMVLLDRVVAFDEERMVTEVTVRDDGLFGDENSVPAWLGIEYMAQTVAAHDGIKRRVSGKPIQLGFLLGTRRYCSNVDHFVVGSRLTITVTRLVEDQGLSVFDCTITGDAIKVSAKLNVYQPGSSVNRVITE